MKDYLKFWFIFSLFCFSCQEEEVLVDESCTDPGTSIFQEQDSILVLEPENEVIGDGWELLTKLKDYSGKGYLQWNGDDHYSTPGKGLSRYQIKINHPGTYKINIRCYIAEGTSSTDHNDVWLRLNDADDYYGVKGDHKVYPKGTGKEPNPNGASADGWFKIYSNIKGQWAWTSKTSDHDPHQVYAQFNNPGTYTIEISGRSSGFAVDRLVLYQEDASTDALSLELKASEKMCD